MRMPEEHIAYAKPTTCAPKEQRGSWEQRSPGTARTPQVSRTLRGLRPPGPSRLHPRVLAHGPPRPYAHALGSCTCPIVLVHSALQESVVTAPHVLHAPQFNLQSLRYWRVRLPFQTYKKCFSKQRGKGGKGRSQAETKEKKSKRSP